MTGYKRSLYLSKKKKKKDFCKLLTTADFLISRKVFTRPCLGLSLIKGSQLFHVVLFQDLEVVTPEESHLKDQLEICLFLGLNLFLAGFQKN